MPRPAILIGIKLLHTAVWAFFVTCILAIPVTAVQRRFDWAAILTGVVLGECLVLAVNRGRCPLTDAAARYTEERAANFDIYLPLWLAARNQLIFGILFAAGAVLALVLWLTAGAG